MSRKQEIFNTIVTHLRKQGAKAETCTAWGGPTCMYRDSEGRKCAAGCLIPDQDYTIDFETGTLMYYGGDPVSDYFMKRYSKDEYRLIQALQSIHDDSRVAKWEEEFAILASDHDLTIPEAA